jgi:transcriptional regulator with XRE-family HTH domain
MESHYAEIAMIKLSTKGVRVMSNESPRQLRRWTQEEIDFLTEHIGEMELSKICKKLGRTKSSVETKADRLNLAIVTNSLLFNISQVAAILGVDAKTIRHWIESYGLPAKNLQLRKQKRKFIDLDSLMKWLKNNPDRWRADRVEEYSLGTEPEWLVKKRREDNKRVDKKHKQRWTKEEIKTIYSMRSMHKSWEEIGKALNRSTNRRALQLVLCRHMNATRNRLHEATKENTTMDKRTD